MKRALVLVAVIGCQTSPPEASHVEGAPMVLSAGSLVVRAPARANGPLHVERSPGAWIDVTAIGATDAPGARDSQGRVVYDGAFAGTRLVHVATAERTEELRHVEHDATSLRYQVKLGPALTSLRVVDDYVEALDARGVALLRTEPAFLVDARGKRRDLVPTVRVEGESFSLSYAIDDRDLVYPLEIDPAWTSTTSLAKARRDNSLHMVPGGNIVAIGGLSFSGIPLSSAEMWDPSTGSWTSAGALARGRSYDGSCQLPSGKVVHAGGIGAAGVTDVESSAEVYDPVTKTSSLITTKSTDPLGTYLRLVPISETQVLIAYDGNSAFLDLSTGTWTIVPYLLDRNSPSLAKLPSGKILLAGGNDPMTSAALSEAEIFDPATKTWKAAASMKLTHARPEMVKLASGKVLAAGGAFGQSAAELYDEPTNAWTLTPSMVQAHSYNTMLLLPSGKALQMGGDLESGITDVTELYDPVANTWTFAGKLLSPLDEFGATVLASGKVMVAGGSNGAPVTTVQIFDPLPNGKACIGAGECTSGFCVEGVCCEKSACSAAETCAGSGAAGACKKVDGTSCAGDAECGSAHCVDGVCCATACTEVCGACNLEGSKGKCSPIAAGSAPQGARGACPGNGECHGRCGGVDITKCTQFPGAALTCAEPKCEAGSETLVAGCDGAGACATPVTRACAPYVCGKTACKTQCDADTDCVDGNACDLVTRKCVIAATCDGDHTVKSPDGKTKDCAPYRCDQGRCIDTCTDSSACAEGYLCDTATSKCVRADAGAADSGGGCATSPRSSEFGLVFLSILAIVRAGRRAKRSTS